MSEQQKSKSRFLLPLVMLVGALALGLQTKNANDLREANDNLRLRLVESKHKERLGFDRSIDLTVQVVSLSLTNHLQKEKMTQQAELIYFMLSSCTEGKWMTVQTQEFFCATGADMLKRPIFKGDRNT